MRRSINEMFRVTMFKKKIGITILIEKEKAVSNIPSIFYKPQISFLGVN